MYLVKTPFWLRWLYPQLTWRKNQTKKEIFLTFDDGPIPVVTPFVLETLNKFDAKATFFCIGDNIQKHPNIYQQVIDAGHKIGNHTYNHLKGWNTSVEIYSQNTLKCQALTQTNLFRPPHGRITKSQIKDLKSKIPNLEIIMWDVLSADYDLNLTPEKCLTNVMKHTKEGSIVVFHDSLKAKPRLEYCLPRALQQWTEAGYKFATL